MSLHAAKKINQKEYLKKYLSGDKVKKKKKDKKHRKETAAAKVRIIDDDAAHNNQTQQEFDEELLLGGEDAPQIVGEYIEDRSNNASTLKWRSIVIKNEIDEELAVKTEDYNKDDLWGAKEIRRNTKEIFSTSQRSSKQEIPLTRMGSTSPMNKQDHFRTNSATKQEDKRMKANHLKQSINNNSSPSQSLYKRSDRVLNQSPHGGVIKSLHSSDQSPPRRHHFSTHHNHHRTNGRLQDPSPPRGNKESPNQSPPRRSKRSPDRHSSKKRKRSSDQSPTRRRKHAADQKHNSSSEVRKYPSEDSRRRSRSPSSGQRKLIKCEVLSDQSPPRYRSAERSRKHSTPSIRRRRKSSSDQSPPRRQNQLNLAQRKLQRNTSPVRIKREQSSSSSDQSPPRKRDDLKKKRSPSYLARSRCPKLDRRNSDSPPPTHKPKSSKTLDGKNAGLQDAKSLMQEMAARRRKEEHLYTEMSNEVSGRDAEVRVRSTGRRGRRARDAEAEDPVERQRKEEHEQRKKEKYDRWGKGLKQVEEHRQRMEAETYEGSKPLARYETDADLDRYLREQERADDPMLEYMRKKRKERQKETGDVIEIPKYEGSYPENRFGIRPGYRWDGVDRSNGFEQKWFDVQNEKRARQEETYLYSVEDM